MRRSWVLADGERKRLTALKVSNRTSMSSMPTMPMLLPLSKSTSSSVGENCVGHWSPSTADTSGLLLTMDKEESDQIQDCLDKMTMIRNQTEAMNPEVNNFQIHFNSIFFLLFPNVSELLGVKQTAKYFLFVIILILVYVMFYLSIYWKK